MGETLWSALCLVLVIEGLLPALAPLLYRRLALSVVRTHERVIRVSGLLMMVSGALLLWLLRHY